MQNALSEIEQEAPRANQITAKNAASSILRAVVDKKNIFQVLQVLQVGVQVPLQRKPK